jgi:hypothetical protein
MRRASGLLAVVTCCFVLAAPRWLPDKTEKKDARARVTIYHVATGRQLDFLKWLAAQDEVAKEAGVATVQLYAHLDGDSWDYLGIGPIVTPEQEKKLDEVASKKGLKTGLQAAFEFRELVASHTDTYVAGPLAAADLVAQATK